MTSTERESEQARQLRQGVRVVQPEAPAGPDFSKVPVAVAMAAHKRALSPIGGVVETAHHADPLAARDFVSGVRRGR